MGPKVIAIGEALVEIMRSRAGEPLDRPGVFHGPFASGAPAIFAVAAARLGLPTGFIGCVGRDAFGRLLLTRLNVEGVDTCQVQVSPDHASGVACVAYATDGSREFVFHLRHAAAGALQADEIDPHYLAGVEWLHLSGSTLALNEDSRAACRQVLELAQSNGAKISFDPNLRPELMPLEQARGVLAPYMAAADLLLPTSAEALALAGTVDEEAAARLLLGDRKRVVALKRGADGCTLYTAQTQLDVPGFAVEELDPTGAGDCFNAACLLGLSEGWPLQQVACFAAAAGALAVTRQGPMEGAPSREAVEAFIQKE